MIKKIGLIGVGHLGQYLVKGFAKADKDLQFFLADPYPQKARDLFSKSGAFVTTRNQEVVDKAQIIIVATRPDDVEKALADIKFLPEQIVVSVAAGVELKRLEPLVSPAKAIRALPISCVAINKSPVLIYPDNKSVQDLFSLLGFVHLMPDEDTFSPGTALVGAFYAWMFLLMKEAASWTTNEGIEPKMARQLVIQTIEGACGMALNQENMSLEDIWETLATPGGISEYGARVLSEKGCISAWSKALDAVTHKMQGK